MTEKQVKNLVLILNKMKTLERNIWIKKGIFQAESVADHSSSLAMLILLLTPPELDQLKCLKMALIHDLPETYCGDFITDEMGAKEKFKLEHNAVAKIAKDLGAPELVAVFDEYETATSPEAKFVKALDKLDNLITANLYSDQVSPIFVRECASDAYPAIMNTNSSASLLSILQALF